MNIDKDVSALLCTAKKYVTQKEFNRQKMKFLLDDITKLLSKSFVSRIEQLDENEFMEKIMILQSITFTLHLITEKQELSSEEKIRLFQSVIASMCAFEDEELAKCFDRILSVLMISVTKQDPRETIYFLQGLLEVVKYCDVEPSSSLPQLITPEIASAISLGASGFFRYHLKWNIISTLFGENAGECVHFDELVLFWPHCRSQLEDKLKNDCSMTENCLRAGLTILKYKKLHNSILDQALFIDELFATFNSLTAKKSTNHMTFPKLLNEIQHFLQDHGKVLIMHKELRQKPVQWLIIYLELIDDANDKFGLLENFSLLLLDLSTNHDIHEFPARLCMTASEICMRRIKHSIQSTHTDCLADYLDILASLLKLARIQKLDIFQCFATEIEAHHSLNNPLWPRILRSLLSVQNPHCQQFCKKFVPSIDKLWITLLNGESSRATLNSLVIVTASCPFANNNDEGVKQIIPFLLIPCFQDFRDRVGSKWDNFRFIGLPKSEPSELINLERFTTVLERSTSESTKLRAVNCALQLEKKTGKYINLVAEMSLAVFSKSQTDRIANSFEPLILFLTDNLQLINDFITILIAKLCEKQEFYSELTILKYFKTLQKLFCLAANGRNSCKKCGEECFVDPDSKENVKIDYESLSGLIKGIVARRNTFSQELIREFLQTSRVMLLHVDSKGIASSFTSIIKALDIGFSENANAYFRVWELVCCRSEATVEKKLQMYIPLIGRSFALLGDDAALKVHGFLSNVLSARLSSTVKATLFASSFAHSVLKNCEIDWNVSYTWKTQFSQCLIKAPVGTCEEALQIMFKRYSTIFTRCFLNRLFFDASSAGAQKPSYDEHRIREITRCYLSHVLSDFNFPNQKITFNMIRPSLLYWSLLSSARGINSKLTLSVIDFICQEMSAASVSMSSISPNPSDIRIVMIQRKSLITETFAQLVQFLAFENNRNTTSFWKFCSDHCDFKDEDIRTVISSYRKQVFMHLLLVSAREFLNPRNPSMIVEQLRATYENIKKGEKFMISTAIETRNEGIEFLFIFRTYFTNDQYFLTREATAESFRILLQNMKQDFFDTNWYIILMTLRQIPLNLDSTQSSWISFIEQINYSILRSNIWRILTDISRIENNDILIEKVWNRLSYDMVIDKISTDAMIKRVFWLIPLEVEKRIDLKFEISKSRQIEDVLEFIRMFPQYPSVQFADNLASKIERKTVYKEELPKLIGSLSRILPQCHSKREQNKIIKILQKLPIICSDLPDHNFIRWDTRFKFFCEPRQLTQAVLEDCAGIVEVMTGTSKIEYVDRTMCEIYKFFNPNEASPEMKSTLDGIKNMYAKMICSQKPEPSMIEQKTIDELSLGGSRRESFSRWLTVIILKCAEMSEDAPLSSLASIAHVDDTRFLSKLAMRFILTVIHMERDSVTQWILSTFEEALTNTNHRRLTNSDRGPASFVFYVFDFIYSYSSSEELRKKKKIWEKVISFWKSMMSWTFKDENGHGQPLIVKVAETFGMEKRCILWLEMFMEQKRKTSTEIESETEAAYYFTLMNLYGRIHELNGVRGAYARLSRIQIDHVYGKISMREAFGDFNSAACFARMTGKGKPFNSTEAIQKLIDELNCLEYSQIERNEQEDYLNSLKTLSQWVNIDNDIGPSPHIFSRNIEYWATESTILKMIRNDERDEIVNNAIENAKSKVIERLSECAIGGSCSYEIATPFLVELQKLNEIVELKNVSNDELSAFNSDFWKNIQKRTDDSEQKISILEPILRVRRSMLDIRMQSMTGRDKENIRSRIVEVHLQSARIARLTGCFERAQLSLINAKKVLPFENKIVLEEAKLQLQTSDELNGMSLLDSIISKNFGDLHTIYTDTQQSVNLDVQKSAKLKIEHYQEETKNLFSSVQMLRISHMIKAGNTIGFDKVYHETTQLLQCFAHSGVMYEAAWLLDYLSNYKERSKHVLPLLKAYKEVAKYEKNQVLQARAVERMTSLWLSNTRKISTHISSVPKLPEGQISDLRQNIKSMNREIQTALEHIGWRAFYPAYAVLARHIDHQDEEVTRTIKQIMKQLILRMPHQCMWQSAYLLRQNIASVKEKYMEVLTEVKRKAPCYVTLIDQYDYASGVFNTVSGKVESDDCKLSEKVDGLKTMFRDKKYDPKELVMNRRVDCDCKILSGIMVPVRSVIDESVHDTEIRDDGFEESCHLPDRYLIHDFSDKVKVLHSNTKPVIIKLTTKTGRIVRLICKKDDDLSKDYHFTKMVEMCNDLLMKDEQTRIQKMTATTYSVIPLGKQGGIIEFMEGVTSFYETLDKLMGMTSGEWLEKLKFWNTHMKPMGKEERTKYFREVACKNTPVVMGKWFRIQYPEAGQWFASRKLFAKSTAVMSVIGYIFGLGDRHTKNLMVHTTGKCIHVDFDMIFNKGETLGTPELVPFRLTQNMINGMGEVALDGEFRTVCEQALRVFRENSYEIEKYIADLPNLVADFPSNKRAPKDFDMSEAKRLVSGRLRGQIMTAKLYRSNPISHPMQVSQLASSLIELATSEEKLSEMYLGWMATL